MCKEQKTVTPGWLWVDIIHIVSIVISHRCVIVISHRCIIKHALESQAKYNHLSVEFVFSDRALLLHDGIANVRHGITEITLVLRSHGVVGTPCLLLPEDFLGPHKCLGGVALCVALLHKPPHLIATVQVLLGIIQYLLGCV